MKNQRETIRKIVTYLFSKFIEARKQLILDKFSFMLQIEP